MRMLRGSPMATQVRPTFEAVRRRRQDLEEALCSLETAIASPAPGREAEWVQKVRLQLSALAASLDRHIEVTEGSGGLHEDILWTAPRLGAMVLRLCADHRAIRESILALSALSRFAPDDRKLVDEIREAALTLLARLARHRQIGADLIYDAYEVDIGTGG
jgi:cytochrome b